VAEHLAAAFGRPVGDLLDAVYEFHPASGPGTVDIGPFTIERDRVNHPIETYAMRITAGGRTLAYSADSGVCDALVKLAHDADVFLCEASYLDGDDNPPDIHLTGREAGEHAARAGAHKLVLTHLVPWGDRDRTLEEATAAYDGEIAVAAQCAVFEI
jgi:ribonuclease BN (tRNA processing enzyme)